MGLRLQTVFVQREDAREIGLRIFLAQKSKERKSVELKIICPSKMEKESKVKQVRRGVRIPVRSAGKGKMIESLSQVGSKITACCRFMQPVEKRLVSAMFGSQSQ